MSAKSMQKVTLTVLRLAAVATAVVTTGTLSAEPAAAALAITTQTDAEGATDLAVEIQLAVNDGPLIDPRDIADVQAGDALAYTYRVTNTGDTVVSSPAVKTVSFTGSGELGAMFCPGLPRSLAPETAFACGSTYVVTDDDASSGDLVHTVVASGTLLSGDVTRSGDTGSALSVVSSQASVGAQVTSGDRGSTGLYVFLVAALLAALLAGVWYFRRRRQAPATARDEVDEMREEAVRDDAG